MLTPWYNYETAITAGVFSSTGKLLGAIPVLIQMMSSGLGVECATNLMVKFLQSTYFMLNNTDFMRWDDAYETCESTNVSMVPNSDYGYAQRSRQVWHLAWLLKEKISVDSLAVLQEAAISLSKLNTLIQLCANERRCSAGLGETMSEDSRTAFENAILAIAAKAPKALIFAQQLNSVNSTRSGELLKITYADRLKDGLSLRCCRSGNR